MQTYCPRRSPPRAHTQHQPNEVHALPTSFHYVHPLTLLPHQHSVIGIIAIPGMMTGAILGGSSVEQAARLQMVIMFMISSSTALASIVTTILALGVAVDSEHRVRTDRIDVRPHAVWRARTWIVSKIVEGVRGAAYAIIRSAKRLVGRGEEDGPERERLLG